MEALTNRQRSVLFRIAEGIRDRGYPPTFREIGAEEGIQSTNGVRSILLALEKKGYIKRLAYRSRAIELTGKGREVVLAEFIGDRIGSLNNISAKSIEINDMVQTAAKIIEIPIIGRVAAGVPLLAEENYDGKIAMDADLAPRGETFALRIKGQSMIDAGINEGDVVFCHVQDDADPGDIVVAMIGDEATVKYYRPEKDRIVLEAANRYFGPIMVEPDSPGFRILGKVVGLYRRF